MFPANNVELLPFPGSGLGFRVYGLPSGKRLHNYGKSQFFMAELTMSMASFNSYFDITRGYIPFIIH